MRTFKEMNKSGKETCPICRTQDEGEVVLIGVVGTEKGGNMVANQFHLKCIDLLYDKSAGIIYQRVN